MRSSKPGNSVYLDIGVWYDEQQGHIHMTARNVDGFHTTVSADPTSKRGHPNSFAKLARCLRDRSEERRVGNGESVRVDLGARRILTQKTTTKTSSVRNNPSISRDSTALKK